MSEKQSQPNDSIISFDSKIELLNKFIGEDIKSENMFFNSSLDYAYYNGGKTTKNFIDALPQDWQNESTVLDSRLHMLMPGWYPAIPGWHHDDVPRNTESGQPDYINTKYHAEHILGMVNSEICPTEFLIGSISLKLPNIGETIYRKWHEEIELIKDNGDYKVLSCPESQLVYFDSSCFHRAVKANQSGWRWFCRVSKNTDRTKSITNEIRKQVQVYLEFPNNGW